MSDIDQLIETASDASVSSFRRRMAIADLAKSPEPRVVQTLGNLLADPDRYIRREIVSSLTRLQIPAASGPLCQATRDEDDTLRREAIEALATIGDEQAVQALKPLLEDRSYSIRNAVARSLEQIEKRLGPPLAESDEPAGEAEETDSEPVIRYAPTESAKPELDKHATAGVVDARIVEASPPAAQIVEAEAVPQFASPPLPAPTEQLPLDWDNAVRMQEFFGDQLTEFQSAYEKLSQRQRAVRRCSITYQETLVELRGVREDELDKLTSSTKAIEALEGELEQLKRQAVRLEREQRHWTRESRSVAYQLETLFSGDKRREDERRRKQRADELHRVYRQKAELGEKLEQQRAEYERLVQPVRELERKLESVQRERDTAMEHSGEAHVAINARLVDFLLQSPPEQLGERLQRLAQRSADDLSIEQMRPLLARAVAEWQQRSAEHEQAGKEFEQTVTQAYEASQALANSIVEGFHVNEVRKQTAICLQGQIELREEHSFLKGYSGASGTASGTGRATADYALPQVQWASANNLVNQVALFATAWNATGEHAARQQLTSGVAACARQAVDDWMYVIRAELERDFEEFI